MIERYSTPQMTKIWSDKNKFLMWLKVELAVLQARYTLGEFDIKPPPNLLRRVKISVKEINRIESEITKHDVMAFLTHISPQFPKNLRPWLHRGLTSYDVGDTALSLQLIASVELIIDALLSLREAIKEKALKYKHLPQIGRTHGIHAEPITLGVKFANWYDELSRSLDRLKTLRERVSVGKISGAVGVYTLHPNVEKLTCDELGLKPVVATQIISRDIIAEYMCVYGILAANVAKHALAIRLGSQTEVAEWREAFGKNQAGSSAMPHKKNPIGTENISGLMRTSFAYVIVAFENLAHCWNERSIDNSGSERVIIPDMSQLLHYGLVRFTKIFKGLEISEKRIEDNIWKTNGLIFSQEVMMLVASKDVAREEAHDLVRKIATECYDSDFNFLEALATDKKIMKLVSKEELAACFNLEKKLQNVDFIFNKVFGQA